MWAGYELKATARVLNRQLRPLQLGRHEIPQSQTPQPNDKVLTLTAGPQGYAGMPARWGLVGNFLNVAPRIPMTTLTGEGLPTKPFYGKIFQRHRCLVPATAFHAWLRSPAGKQKMRIRHPGGEPMMFAGIYDHHPQAGTTCAIVTVTASADIRTIDQRMPLILNQESCHFWLAEHPEFPADDFEVLLSNPTPLALAMEAIIEPEPSAQLAFAFA